MKGVKKLRKAEALEESVQASGTSKFELSKDLDAQPKPSGLGLETGAAVEAQKTQALK